MLNRLLDLLDHGRGATLDADDRARRRAGTTPDPISGLAIDWDAVQAISDDLKAQHDEVEPVDPVDPVAAARDDVGPRMHRLADAAEEIEAEIARLTALLARTRHAHAAYAAAAAVLMGDAPVLAPPGEPPVSPVLRTPPKGVEDDASRAAAPWKGPDAQAVDWPAWPANGGAERRPATMHDAWDVYA